MFDFDTVGELLHSHAWIFAKTMPENPHEYTLRKTWGDSDFIGVVEYIRHYGYKAYFKNRPYIQLDINGRFYWTMGAPIKDTILINRKEKQEIVDYDRIAPVYDDLFIDAESLKENDAIIRMIGDVSNKSVLDIGCGSGLFLDYANPGRYVGVDPSGEMLRRLLSKHPGSNTVQCKFTSFTDGKHDVIISLFGAASYLSGAELDRIPVMLNPGGHYFLMFYKPGYIPVTYQKTGVTVSHFTYEPGRIPGKVSELGNFIIVEGQ